MFDLVIASGTVSIGDFDLSGLPVAERQGGCVSCSSENGISCSWRSSRPPSATPRRSTSPAVVAVRNRRSNSCCLRTSSPRKSRIISTTTHTYTTTKGDTLDYRLVTGEDRTRAFSRKGGPIAEQNSIILSRCITKMNGGLLPDPLGSSEACRSRTATTCWAFS